MSRIISDLAAGTMVYVDENEVHTPYIYLGLNDNGDAVLLRQYAVQAKRMHSSNVASYAGCEMDVWLENETDGFLSRFDAATINALQSTAIKYVDYNQNEEKTSQVLQISRRCFLLSYSEEGYGDNPAGNEGSSFLPALEAFYETTNANTARITRDASGNAVGAWVRSADSVSRFRVVNTGGNAGNYYATNTSSWSRPALSVAPATIVSDEGADAIFLLPDGRRTTWNVEMDMLVGECSGRPVRAQVALDMSDITSYTVQVCNNYGDTTPVWVTVPHGEVASLTNEQKTTDKWKVGIKISAAGNTTNSYIGEPTVIVNTVAG